MDESDDESFPAGSLAMEEAWQHVFYDSVQRLNYYAPYETHTDVEWLMRDALRTCLAKGLLPPLDQQLNHYPCHWIAAATVSVTSFLGARNEMKMKGCSSSMGNHETADHKSLKALLTDLKN